jgi:hypothetical protein
MKQTLACTNCGKLLAELSEKGIKSYGFGIKVNKGAYHQDLAWAVCTDCSAETPFNAEFLKAILKEKDKK